MDKTYNIRCGAPLMLDHEYAHCANTVEFQGFGREQAISSVYLLLGRPVQLKIPLTDDFKLLVTAPITRKAGKVKAQLMECKLAEDSEEEYEYVRYSDIFEVVITPSLAEESQIEVTDPRLELIYTDMHEHYLELLQHEYTAEQSAAAAAASEANALASANNAASSESAALMSSLNASAASTQAGQRASLALEQALVSEGYAVGKQNGEAVPSTSPYYENNSEYYADQAAQSAAFLQNVSAEATTLPAGSDATASYDDGVFAFGIPQGIKGDKGDTGDTGIPGVSPQVTVQSILGGHRIIITDSNSISQFDVMDGARGQQGEQGVGITDIQLTADYGLQITLSNGTVFITSSIRGEQGETGNGISSITKTATVGKVDTYTITYTDGTTTTFDVTNGEVTEASLEEALYDKADVIENSASGTIASFSDGAEMPVKSLEVEINAVQSGSGDPPSPTNIRPISGRNSVELVRNGVNQWDEEWEVGRISTTTGENTVAPGIRSKNFVPVLPSTAYFLTSPRRFYVIEYDVNKNYVRYAGNFTNAQYTTSANAFYIRFYQVDVTTYDNDVSINYPSTDTDYHAYNGTTYPITLPNICYGGKIKDGVLTIDKAIMDLSTRTWARSGYDWRYTCGTVNDMKVTSATAEEVMCSAYNPSVNSWATYRGANICINQKTLILADDRFQNDANGLMAWLREMTNAGTPVMAVYPLATPIEITLSDFPTIETVKGVNNLWADSGDVAVIYRADTKAYIDGTIVDVPLAMIAPIETGTKSSKAYAVGEYFILNGNQFCKAKTAIASGATFTLNTNYTVTTIGAELKALQ